MWKREPASPPSVKNSATPAAQISRWHAVSVVSKGDACDACWALSEKRFLSREAPRLPLTECTKVNECRCAYQHHADRRGEPRRRQEVGGLWLERYTGDERRRARGRRVTDNPQVNDWRG